MTHEQLDIIGPQIEKNCNYAIEQQWPSWSRYAQQQMIDRLMAEMAPDWDYMMLETIGQAPRITLTQYRGDIG